MSVAGWVGIGTAVLASGYAIHGMVTDTGAAGWINYAQQSVFGSYSLKMTAVVLMMAVALLAAGAVMAAAALGLDRQAGGSEPRPVNVKPIVDKPLGWSGWLKFCAVCVALTWIIGYAIYAWNTRTGDEDRAASYERIALTDPARLPVAGGKHVALLGEPLAAHYLSHRRKSSSSTPDYHLVPIIAPGWKEGQSVGYVLQTSHLPALGPAFGGVRRFVRPGAPPPAPEPILGRIEGEVPVTAAKAFEKAGVPLAPQAKLVRWIPSREGAPDLPDSSEQDRWIFLGLCGAISAVWILVTLIAGFAAQRRSGG